MAHGANAAKIDPQAAAALDAASRWFRIFLSNLIVTLEPQVVVLGGYLAFFTDQLTPRVKSTLAILGTEVVAGAGEIRPSARWLRQLRITRTSRASQCRPLWSGVDRAR